MNKISAAASIIIAILLSPILIVLARNGFTTQIDTTEMFWALKNSILQASFSAYFAVILGLVISSGLVKYFSNPKIFSSLKFLLFLPSILPPLFSLILFLSAIDPFPVGIIGITIVHGIMYAGFVAILFSDLLVNESLAEIETAMVLGANKNRIWRLMLSRHKWKIFSVFMMVFSISFSSFSIPLAVGGGRGTTLEILIYEKIRISNDWSQAVTLSIVQLALVLLLSFLQAGSSYVKRISVSESIVFLKTKIGQFALVVYTGFFVLGFLYFAFNGWNQVVSIDGLLQSFLATIPVSLALSVGGGFCILALLISFVWGWPDKNLRKFLLGYIAPSASLIGFSFLFVASDPQWLLLKYIFAFAILCSASLYRLGLDMKMQSLTNQIQVARSLGAMESHIFFRIVFPQIAPLLFQLAGIAAVWILGDFALAKILFSETQTSALFIEGLMSSYRIDASASLFFILLLLSAVVYKLFSWVGHVIGTKSI